ncbi:hypothetical protein Bca4012_065945 [Brassica carinata]
MTLPLLPEHAIFASVQCGDIVTLRHIITADPSILQQTTAHDRQTLLPVAAAGGHIEVLSLLLEQFTNPDVLESSQADSVNVGCNAMQCNAWEDLLRQEARSRNLQVLMFDSVNRRTCLHYAAYYGHADCVQAILSAAHSSPVALHWWEKSDKGATPLHLAAGQRSPECVNVLLDSGSLVCASTRLYGSPGSAPLHLAAKSGSIYCVRKLLALGADRLQRDASGYIINHSSPPHFLKILCYIINQSLFTDKDKAAANLKGGAKKLNRLENEGYYGGVRLLMAICKVFRNYCKDNAIHLHQRNFTLSYDTNIPRQTGLSGSSAIISAALSCLLDFYNVRHLIKLQVRPNLVLSAEKELGIVAGRQDRVAQVYGGLVHMVRGGSLHSLFCVTQLPSSVS